MRIAAGYVLFKPPADLSSNKQVYVQFIQTYFFICNKRENNQQKKNGTITHENKYIKIILKG